MPYLLIDTCEAIRECRGFDFNDNSIHHIFRKYNYVFDNSSFFILRNNGTETNDIGYMTTTTSVTTSPTTTQTSSITTTQTLSPTTTMTSTTSLTTSMTSSLTTSATTSLTSSQTYTQTSTQTTSVTTTNIIAEQINTNSLTGTEISLIVICILFALVSVAFLFIYKRRRENMQHSLENSSGPNNFNPSFQDQSNSDVLYTEDSHYRDIAPFYTDSPVESPKYITTRTSITDSDNGYMDVSKTSRSSLNSSGSPRSPSRVIMSTL